MADILYFVDIANIAVLHIKMDKSTEKLINVHIKEGKIIHFKACEEGLFYTNLNNPTIITNLASVSLNAYSYLSTVKKIDFFYWFWNWRSAKSLTVIVTSSLSGDVKF